MASELERYRPTTTDVARVTRDYDAVRVAGAWEHKPRVPPTGIFPFLALSMSKNEVPLKAVPLFRLDAGVTSERSTYPFPIVKVEDNYSDLAEEGLVQIVSSRRFSKERQVQVWLPRRVNPLGLHPPIVEAVDSLMRETGVDWAAASLEETDINKDFVTYKAAVPRQELVMELGGPAQTVTAAALAASAMRLAVAETIAIQDGREVMELYLQQHPEVKLIRGGEAE
jgi:hypothetical protein